MPRSKWNLNTIYISERLQESLRPAARCALTTVIAPMGYGKTTAINWYLEEREKSEQTKTIRVSVYSGNFTIFWNSLQEAFARAGFEFLREYDCPTDAIGSGILVDRLCHELAGENSCYIFIDDFHLLTDERAAGFLCKLTYRLPGNVHLIVASRAPFLPPAENLRLGSRVYQIGTEELRLNYTELGVYAHRCGTDLSDAQVEKLLYSSEGWFSAVYLNLRTFSEHGILPDRNSDIYTTFTAAMIDPLPERQREFLAVMGLADEFTVDMARFVTGDDDSEVILAGLTSQNAFVKCLSDGITYRFHHMMKECAERSFQLLKSEKKKLYLERFGIWYENRRQYLHALSFYRKNDNFDALLRVVMEDAGVLLSSIKPSDLLEALDQCPVEVLKNNPFAILVLMRSMFTWRQIPRMMQLKGLLMAAIEENPEMPAEERGNLLGECDLIMSFLCYNDITAMSRLHRSADAQMSRPAISIHNDGGWTFGSPSVLMMFYRAPGMLQSELTEMDECMPHYYKITDHHGQGAEKIMRAEAAFMQGRFTDALIELECAYAEIEGNGQVNMALCCDFLAWRLSMHTGVEHRFTLEERFEQLLKLHNASWINIWCATSAYYHALRRETEEIPELFRQHRLGSVNILAPGRPMIEMIENQVYLAQGAYTKVIGRSEGLLAVCAGMHYAMVGLHIYIQTAAAYEMLGKKKEARELLEKALAEASPDRLIMPFVENYSYLENLLEELLPKTSDDFESQILEYGKMMKHQNAETGRAAALADLTDREYEIVCLMAKRLSNREIAGQLYLSEGSVKQYVKQIYSKLQIEGGTRTKRARLLELLEAGS